MKRVKGFRGFTLVELLVVTAILGVLVALMIPSYKGIMSRSHMGKCAANLRQIGVAAQVYLGENNNVLFPDARLTPNGQANLPSDIMGRWIGAINEVMERPTSLPTSQDLQGRPLEILMCPADKTQGGWKNLGAVNGISGDRNTEGIKAHSYLPNRLVLNRKITEITRPSRTIMLTDFNWGNLGTRAIYPLSQPWMSNFPEKWHNKLVNCLFVDGHVEPLSIASLQVGQPNAPLWYVDYPDSGLGYK
jgi:general secretion pathway protein G